MTDKKTWQQMTPDEMVQHAKDNLQHLQELTPEQEAEQDAEMGYFDDDDNME